MHSRWSSLAPEFHTIKHRMTVHQCCTFTIVTDSQGCSCVLCLSISFVSGSCNPVSSNLLRGFLHFLWEVPLNILQGILKFLHAFDINIIISHYRRALAFLFCLATSFMTEIMA